jgi:hypothetical protein
MIEIKQFDLNGLGATYVNSRLRAGGSLSRSFVRVCGPVDNAFAPLPEGTSEDQVSQFQQGGIATRLATLKWLAVFLAAELPSSSARSLLIEDAVARPGDAVIRLSRQKPYISGETVMYGTTGEDLSEAGLSRLLRDVSSFDYTAFIAATALPQRKGEPAFLSDNGLAEYSRSVRFVCVSAFDQESFVVSSVPGK